MGLYIRLNTEGGVATVRDRLRARIAFGGLVWSSFEGHFYPSSVEIWRNATLVELDGQLLQSFELDPKSRSASMMDTLDAVARKMQFEDLLYSIILIKGIWHVDGRSLVGYISINNAPTWRKMYQDIEVDAETHVSAEDFADVILRGSDMGEHFVREFIRRVSEYRSDVARLSAIYFFDGPMARAEIYNAKSVYYQAIPEYVADLLISYRTELKEKEEKRLMSAFAPYNERFLVSSLMKDQQFQEMFNTDLARSEILEIRGNSVLFLGKKNESFREAYDLLKKDVFDKLARGLKPAEVIKRDIANALGSGQKAIDEDES